MTWRMTERERAEYATRPDAIPADIGCDKCGRAAVARGTDGHRAFAFCAEHYMDVLSERRAQPRVSAADRAQAIQEATS